MPGSYSKKHYIISYPDSTGGRAFFDRENFDVDIRKVDDDTFKVDVEWKQKEIKAEKKEEKNEKKGKIKK